LTWFTERLQRTMREKNNGMYWLGSQRGCRGLCERKTDRDSNPRYTTLKESMLTITPPMWFITVDMLFCNLLFGTTLSCNDMSTHGLLFQWASTIKIQLSVLV
jgi:hypothetical protein